MIDLWLLAVAVIATSYYIVRAILPKFIEEGLTYINWVFLMGYIASAATTYGSLLILGLI